MSIRKSIAVILASVFILIGISYTGYSQSTDTLSNGLVGFWKFDAINNTSFTTADTSSNGNNGTVGTTSRLVAGKFGQAMKFDENVRNQYMTTSKTFTSPQWSVSTWINPEFPLPLVAPYNGLIAFFSTDPGGQMLGIQKGGVYMYTTKITSYDFANNPGWHHIVVTYDGTNLTAIVDNSVKASIPYKNLMASNIKRHVGVNVPDGTYHMFKGMIDETRLYSRLLTNTEITALFNNTASAPVAPTPTLTPTLISTTPVPVSITPPPVTSASPAPQSGPSSILFNPKNTTPKDLFANIQNEIDSRIGTLIPSDANKNLWVQPRGNGTGGWTKNPAVWTGNIDWSGVSPWNNDFTGNTLGYAKAGTLVSPKHVIFANHFRILNGSNIIFIDKNGQTVTRRVVDYRNIAGTDITVASLDIDVPNTVSFYPVFKKSDLEKYLNDKLTDATFNLPFVLFDKDDHIFVRSTNKNKLFDANTTTVSHDISPAGKRKDFNETVVLGDSGNPGFVIVGGQPVLIFTNFDSTVSHSISYFINQINTAMTSLGGGYQLSTINLTGFTEPTASVGHPAETIVQSVVLTTDKTNYKLNEKMQFKAVFTVKPEWVTWMKNSNQTQGSVVFTLTDPDNKVIIQGSNTFVPIATSQTVTFDWNIPDSAVLANRTYQLQVNVADSKNAGLFTTKINNIKIDPIPPQVDGSIAVTITWPRGVLPEWTKYTHISVTANKKVFCKVSKTAGVAYDQMELAFDSRVPLLKPEVSIDGLTPGEAYNYYVKCADTATGEKMTTDVPVAFSVARMTSAPEIRDLEASAVRSTSAEIVWSTTREATSRVEYSVQGSSNIKVSEDLLPTIPHAQLLLGLTPNTTYTYKVISKDKFNNKVESSSKTFKTKPVSASRVFYISKDGNDINDGLSLSKPFATFERALLAIKSLGTIPEGGVDVMVRAGTYYRTAPLVLDSTVSGTLNSPVTFKAYNNEKVILSGGASVTGFQTVTSGDQIYSRLDPSAKGSVVKVNLKEKGITNFGILERSGVSKPGGGDIAFLKSHSLQFYFNDNPMTLARWPNTGYSRVDSGQASSSFIPRDDRASRWINLPKNDFWVYGAFGSPFRDSFEKISSITKTSDNKYSIGITAPGPRFGFEVAAPFFYLNILEELDSPGEWYLDRTSGVLYFWPPSSVDSGKAAVSLTSSIVDFKGASNIKFFGFIFENARDSAVNMDTTSSHNMIEKSVIRNSSIGAIIHGRDNGIWGSEVYNIDDDAIMLNGGDPVRLTNGSNYVVNSKIHTYALRNKMYRAGVNMSGGYVNDQKTGGVGNRARYNEIYNAPHNAVLVQANNMIVDYNKISNVTRECVDCGAVYAWYQWQQRGNVYRYNLFKSIKDTVGGREGNHQLRNIGVYFDMDVDQSIIYGNIFDDVSTGVLFNGGRDSVIENNIFVNSNEPLYLGVAGMTFGSNTMRNPIVDVSKTTPLVITTQREHNLGRYGEVTEATIEGVEGEPNANGTRKSVTRIDDYRIQLNNTTPAGSYTSGGFFSSNFRFYLFLDEYRYLQPPYSIFYPTLTQRKTEVDDAQPKGNSVKNNILFRNTKQSLTTVHAREAAKRHIPLGINFNSTDPQFENLAGGDYRLKSSSPLLGQGFVNIPVASIGLLKTETQPPVVDPPPLNDPVPTTKLTSNLSITTNKIQYIAGESVKMTVTFTLDPTWVTYLKAKGQTQGEILFSANNTNVPGSFMQARVAFDLVTTPITKTYDWVVAADSDAAGKTYTVAAEVYDANKITKETKTAPSITISKPIVSNTAPVSQNVTVKITSPSITTSIVLNATDTEKDILTYTPSTLNTPKGTLIKTAEGKYTYTLKAPIPVTSFKETFTYTASDGKLTSLPATVTIDYVYVPIPPAPNTAPVVKPVTVSLNANSQAVVTPNGIDAESNLLTYTPNKTILTYGTILKAPNGTFIYTLSNKATNGVIDTFSYTASDGKLTSLPALVTINIPKIVATDTDKDSVIDSVDLCPNTPVSLQTKIDSYGCPKPLVSTFDIKPAVNNVAPKNIVNLILGRTNLGQLRFNQPVNLSRDNAQLDVDSNVLISNKRIEVNSLNIPELNKPATITLYNVTETDPKILKNGVPCPETVCKIDSFKDGVLTFTVNGF